MAKAKPKKSKGLLGRAASLLGSIPAVGNVRNAAKKVGKATKLVKKTVKKATKKAKKVVKSSKKKVKKTLKKAKKKVEKKAKKKRKKLKKKVGKVYTKARKLKNNLSKNKRVKKLKRKMKKTVLTAKKGVKKVKTTAKKVSNTTVKNSKKIMKKATLGARAVGEFTKNGFNGKEVASVIVDFIPIVGNAKGAYEATFGKDPFTGRKLDKIERAAAGAAVIGGPLVKGGTRGVRLVSGILPGGKKATEKVPVPKVMGDNTLGVKLTKEQLTTKPLYSPVPEKWVKKGGTVKKDEDGTWVYTNKKKQTVRYPDGYPDFTEYSHPTVKPVEIEIANPTNRPLDYKTANGKAGLNKDSDPSVASLNKAPEGYTWHHHQDGKTMILVDKKVHREFTHAGGVSIVNGK